MTNAGQPTTAVVTPEMVQGQWGPVLTFDNAGASTPTCCPMAER